MFVLFAALVSLVMIFVCRLCVGPDSSVWQMLSASAFRMLWQMIVMLTLEVLIGAQMIDRGIEIGAVAL